ncbi:MAG: HD domain-containing protein [Candidatus Pacearchaeota archaeon]
MENDKLYEFICELVKEKCGEGILNHSRRVNDLALLLSHIYGGDKKVITLSTLLHDIAIKEGFSSHAKRSSKITRELFRNRLDPILLKKICYCIKYHSITSPKPKKIISELKCIYDADKIDVLLTGDIKKLQKINCQNIISCKDLRNFIGDKSLAIYNLLRRLIKWYKK